MTKLTITLKFAITISSNFHYTNNNLINSNSTNYKTNNTNLDYQQPYCFSLTISITNRHINKTRKKLLAKLRRNSQRAQDVELTWVQVSMEGKEILCAQLSLLKLSVSFFFFFPLSIILKGDDPHSVVLCLISLPSFVFNQEYLVFFFAYVVTQNTIWHLRIRI